MTTKPKQDFLPFCPRKLISLWEMINFCVGEIVSALNWLKGWGDHAFIQVTETRDSKATAEDKTTLLTGLNPIEKGCEKHELSVSLSLCVRLKKTLESEEDFFWQVIQSEIDGISQSIQKELNATKFTFIQKSKEIFFEQEKLFGDAVWDAFPEARVEVKDAGNCLASDLNTAAIFHLMRVAEIGLRKLAKPLKIKLSCQIEFATWGNVTTAIDNELQKIKSTPRTNSRDKKLQHYSQLLLDIRSFQYLWRDPVSHLRGRYDELQARSAFNHVRAFMEKLTEKI